jgi:hypothetical protein
MEEEYLSQTTLQQDGFSLGKKIHDEFGDNSRRITDLLYRQVAEEDVHGRNRLLLKLTVTTMKPLPTTVARYMGRKNMKHTLCTPGSWKRPVKIKSFTLFIVAMGSRVLDVR